HSSYSAECNYPHREDAPARRIPLQSKTASIAGSRRKTSPGRIVAFDEGSSAPVRNAAIIMQSRAAVKPRPGTGRTASRAIPATAMPYVACTRLFADRPAEGLTAWPILRALSFQL